MSAAPDPDPGAAARPSPEQAAPLRAAVRSGAAGAVVLAVLAAVLGLVVRGAPGLWGGVVGAAVAAGFVVFTAVAVLLSARLDPTAAGAVLLGSWIVKLLLLVVVLALLRGLTFYDRTTLGVTVLAATVGLLVLETLAVLRTRVPYVDPHPGA